MPNDINFFVSGTINDCLSSANAAAMLYANAAASAAGSSSANAPGNILHTAMGFAFNTSNALGYGRSLRLYYPSTDNYTVINGDSLARNNSYSIPALIDGFHSGPRTQIFPFLLKSGLQIDISIGRLVHGTQDGALSFWISTSPMDNILFNHYHNFNPIYLNSAYNIKLYDRNMSNIPQDALSLTPDTVYFLNIQNNSSKVDRYKLVIK